MFIKTKISSLFLTTALAMTLSFANYPGDDEPLEVAAPTRSQAAPAPKKTSSFVLTRLQQTLDKLKGHEAEFQENERYLQNTSKIHSSRTPLEGNLRVRALKKKFQEDAKKSITQKQSGLYAALQAEKFDTDISSQVWMSLKGYASKIGYKGICNAYQRAYINAMLSLDPVRQDQHKKFETFAEPFTDVLSLKTLMDDEEFIDTQKKMQEWDPSIDASKVSAAGNAFNDAKSDFAFAHKNLNAELQDLIETARKKQQRRDAFSSNKFIDKVMTRGRKSVRSLYRNLMGTFFDFRLNA